MKNDNSDKKKLPYEKPRLRRLELRADEVLAKGCKTSSPGAGPSPGGLSCLSPQCFNAGS